MLWHGCDLADDVATASNGRSRFEYLQRRAVRSDGENGGRRLWCFDVTYFRFDVDDFTFPWSVSIICRRQGHGLGPCIHGLGWATWAGSELGPTDELLSKSNIN